MDTPIRRRQRRTLWFVLIASTALVTAGPRPSARTDGAQNPTATAPPAQGRGEAGRAEPGRGAAGNRAGGPGLSDAANVGGDGSKPPVVALTPEEEAKRFILPPGYKLELVLSDPTIISPAVMAFDGNGRLFIAEERSYMLDVDAGRQHEPISRISMHESTKRDGVFDRHTVFADNLLFPRMILPLDQGILTNETHSDDVLLLNDFSQSAGGRLIYVPVGTANFAFDRTLRETSAYYLLGVEPAPADRDGRPRKLDVKVKRRDVSVRSRQWVVIPPKG